tara:strand:+ start:4339 stop:4998 length:660 start_codon:yes stop_codon:yes gene_type:complete
MISIVIPTLWGAEEIYETIESFKQHKTPTTELIIIDNTNSDFKDSDITIIKPNINTGVNPAWNAGVALASYDNVLLLNDDITINFKLFFEFLNKIDINTLDYGILACDRAKFTTKDINKDNDELSLEENQDGRFFGFGCFMVVNRNYYHPIPQSLKIFYGDDFLYFVYHDMLELPIKIIKNLRTKGRVETTSGDFGHLLQDEVAPWQNIVGKVRRYYAK